MHEQFMKLAIKEALKAKNIDEVPIGAVIVKDGKVIAKAHNLREKSQCATAHAEILAIQKACKKLGSWRLNECTMYVTLEPCPMCAGALILSRIDTIVYGASDYKGGSINTTFKMYEVEGFNHYPRVISNLLEQECSLLLSDFFKSKRMLKKAQQE